MAGQPPEIGTLRLAFLGSPDFAVPALDALVRAGHEIACVYAQPPQRAGRGKRLRPCPVHAQAEAQGLPVRTPADLRTDEEVVGFRDLDLDAAVVAAFGQILPPGILEAPRLGCLNIHASLLPRWRGAAPIARAIMAGDVQTGISIMLMDEGLDTGPVLVRGATPIDEATTAGALHDRLADMGAELIPGALAGYRAGTLRPEPQDDSQATYAPRLTREDRTCQWDRPAWQVVRQIHGLAPSPGVSVQAGATRLKLLGAEPVPAPDGAVGAEPGTVLDTHLTVACGDGAVRLTRLQRPGKAPMSAAELLRGFALPPGTVLA